MRFIVRSETENYRFFVKQLIWIGLKFLKAPLMLKKF